MNGETCGKIFIAPVLARQLAGERILTKLISMR